MALAQEAESVFARRSDLVNFYTQVDAPSHPGAIKLLNFWRTCVANDGDFVVGRDIPVRAIAPLLQNVIVAEPLSDDSDMLLRLTGAAVRHRFAGTPKSHYLSELFPPGHFAHYTKCIVEFLRVGEPIVLDSRLGHTGHGRLHAEIVLMPAKSPDRSADWLLAGLFYFD